MYTPCYSCEPLWHTVNAYIILTYSILDDEALNLREQNKEIIHRKCGRHSYCQRFDINLLCFKPPMGGRFGTCECRPFTQWNNQTDELSGASHSSCQVYVVSSTLCFSHRKKK